MKKVISDDLIPGRIYRDTLDHNLVSKFKYLDSKGECDTFVPVTMNPNNRNYSYNKDGTIYFGYTDYDDPWYYFEEDNLKLGK